MIYGIIIGNYAFFGTFNMINAIPTILILLYATRMASQGGTKKALIKWTTFSIIAAVALVAFILMIDPRQISELREMTKAAKAS